MMAIYHSKGRLDDLLIMPDGSQRLTIQLSEDFRQEFDKLKDFDVEISVKRWRPKRSLDANGYAWVLIDQIAERLRISKTEVYRNAIKEIGGVSDAVCAQNSVVSHLRDMWSKKGLGWQSDVMPSKIPGCSVVILYYGSSEYDTEQMSRLIDYLVQDAEALGIETRTPQDIARLLDEYGCVEGVT